MYKMDHTVSAKELKEDVVQTGRQHEDEGLSYTIENLHFV